MHILNQRQQTHFNGAWISAASYLEEKNMLLNKAIVDASVDIPFICLANNKTEQKERIRRIAINYPLCFLSPLVTLPLTNRLAMKYVGKLTKSIWSNSHKAIHISNEFLKDSDSMINELKKMMNETPKSPFEVLFNKLFPKIKYEQKINLEKLLESCDGDKEKLRQKIIKSKNAVLSFDFLFSAGSVCGMAFLNNAITKKTTKRDGYSAEFELASKEIVDKRAEKYKKSEPLRKGLVAIALGLLTLLPFAIRRGLISSKAKGLYGLIKKHASKFDYSSGIFMKRLPLFLFMTLAYGGIAMASRNETELKNNLLMGTSSSIVFFGGDIVINNILSKISDKYLKTEIIDKNAPKTFKNKILPKTIPISQLKGKSQKVATVNFFINLATLAYVYGYGTPYLMNKIIRKDLKKETAQILKNQPITIGNIKIEDFIKRAENKTNLQKN